MLEVGSIDVSYGDLQALWGISFNVQKREIVVLIGPNGAGKTTILRTLSGLLRPTAGRIVFLDHHLDKTSPYKIVELGLCHVPEGRALFPGMSVLENLELGAYVREARKMREESFSFVFEILPILNHRSSQLAGTLSGGEQQMLAIGRGLMSKPKLLLLDEPSWGLSPLLSKTIFEVIGQVNHSGVTILLVEQNVQMALGLGNRAYVIENGRMVRAGDAKDLLHDEQIKDAYLGSG